MLLAKGLTQSETENREAGPQTMIDKRFFIEREKRNALLVRIHFLAYEAHVDLLEIVSFFATINLAALCTQGATAGLPGDTFAYLFRFCPPYLCMIILIVLAGIELWASLFDRIKARCLVQAAAALVFISYAILVFCKSPWIPSPRDYIIFGIMAGVAHLRLRVAARSRKKKYAGLSKIADAFRERQSDKSKSKI